MRSSPSKPVQEIPGRAQDWRHDGYRYVALRDVIGREMRNLARKTIDMARERQVLQGDEACKILGDLLNSGTYFLNLLIVEDGSTVVYEHQRIASFIVEDVVERKSGWLGKEPGVVQPRLIWTSERCAGDWPARQKGCAPLIKCVT